MTRTFAFLSAALAAAAVAVPARAGDWYRWRGPEQTGVSRESGLPEKFNPDTGENLVWKAPYGGMASPVVLNGRVYTITRANEEKAPNTLIAGPRTQEAVVCLDAESGKLLWEHRENIFQTTVPFHRLGWSNPAADPETGYVYVLCVPGTLLCLNGEDGKVVWRRQLFEEFGYISTFGGRTQTPAVDEDQVFLGGVFFGWGDHARGRARMFAFDKKTGRLNWTGHTEGIPNTVGFNTPQFTVVNGVRQVVWGGGDGAVHGFKARTGERLWSFPLSKLGINASTVVAGSRVYACHSEENLDAATLGRVVCLDVGGPKPKEVWRADRVEAGFATPLLHEGRLYVVDNSGTLLCFDADTGSEHWKLKLGTMGRASPVFADGKLYVGEANGRFYVLRPGKTRCEKVSMARLESKKGREYAIYGAPAVANGRIYLPCANTLYCIGGKDAKPTAASVPDSNEPPAGAPAVVQVVPADVLLKPGQKVKFEVRLFDAAGRPVTQLEKAPKPQWSIGQLTLVLPSGKSPIGNLKGEVSEDGTFTAAGGPPQGGAVVVRMGELTGHTRVRVLPPLPWKIDFETAPEGKPPMTWINVGGKFAVAKAESGGGQVLRKLTDIDLYANARAFFGPPDMADYAIETDVTATSKTVGEQTHMPDAGVINSRYCLAMLGNLQKLQIYVWPPALPGENDPTGSLNATVPFAWKAGVKYRLKLEVRPLPGGKAAVRGKCWPAGEAEPAAWTVALEDPQPNLSGSPGLFAFSNQKLPIEFDNITVTPNKKD